MKTFREFIIEISASDIPKNDPGYGGGMSTADIDARTDLTPEQKAKLKARRSKVSSKDAGLGGQTSSKQPSPSPQQQKPKSKTPGRIFRGGVGALSAVDAADAVASGDYGRAAESGLYAAGSSNRLNRNVSRLGQRAVQGAASRLGMNAAGKVASRFVPGLQTAAGLTSGSRALARGDKLGAILGYGSAIPGPVGYGFAAADIAREFVPSSVKKSIKDRTGITYLQQRKGLEQKAIQSGQGLRGIDRARQTMDTRGARQVAARTGAYGARQGSALTGIGGNTITSKDTKGNAFISTGAGSQRRTAQLAKTQLVRDPKTGKQVVGDLAFKGGKATYLARPSIASRDTSLAARVGRALNIGKYSRSAEQQASKQEYRTALRNTQQYQKQLGVKSTTALPGRGVGPKKVGPKLVGPKKVGPKIVGPRKPAPKPSPSVMARPV